MRANGVDFVANLNKRFTSRDEGKTACKVRGNWCRKLLDFAFVQANVETECFAVANSRQSYGLTLF